MQKVVGSSPIIRSLSLSPRPAHSHTLSLEGELNATSRLLHPELVEQCAPLWVELVVADSLRDEIDDSGVVGRDGDRLREQLPLDSLPEQRGRGRIFGLNRRSVLPLCVAR